MQSRLFATTLPTAAVFVLTSCEKASPAAEAMAPFSVVEASIPDMQKAMAEGRVTSEEIVKQYLIRIASCAVSRRRICLSVKKCAGRSDQNVCGGHLKTAVTRMRRNYGHSR